MSCREIIINNCHDCPFSNNDNEFGYNDCIIKFIDLKKWEQLPSDKVHDKCPLLIGDIKVKAQKIN